MDPEAPSGVARRGKRRGWRWFAVALVALPFAAFGLSNLALDSTKGRGWLAARIKTRTTLDASIGGATWSPWNGITLRSIRLEQPSPLREAVASPLADIGMLNVKPVWKAALRGHLDIRRITLEKPAIVLPLQLIAHFAPPTAQPPVARTDPPSQSPPIPQPHTAPAPQSTPTPEPPEPPPASPSPLTTPTDFIELNDGSFSLVFAGHPTPLAELKGITGTIPVAGREAESHLAIASIHFPGGEAVRDLRLPLSWKSPLLTSPATDATLSGLRTKIAIQLAFVPGLPLAVEVIAPDQEMQPLDLPGGARFTPRKVSAAFRFRGALLTPPSWQADAIAAASKPVILSDGHETKFDLARAATILRGGTLSCVDARLTGDDVSFLGNATVLSDGRTAAVLRVVAPPETGAAIVRKLFPGVTSPPAFRSMSSPQRAALDIEASGSLGDLEIRLGKNGPLIGRETPPASATPK